MFLMNLVNFLRREEEGVTTAEYAVMLVLVAIAVATFGPGLEQGITGVFSDLVALL